MLKSSSDEGIKIERQIIHAPSEECPNIYFAMSLFFILRGVLILIKKSDDVVGIYSECYLEVIFNLVGCIVSISTVLRKQSQLKDQTQEFLLILHFILFGYLLSHVIRIFRLFEYDLCDRVHPDDKGFCSKYISLVKVLLLYDINGLIISGMAIFQVFKTLAITRYQNYTKYEKRETENSENAAFLNT